MPPLYNIATYSSRGRSVRAIHSKTRNQFIYVQLPSPPKRLLEPLTRG